MADCSVTFYPQNKKVGVPSGSSLLDAVSAAGITINNLCGGDGICGRCKMIVLKGDIAGEVTGKLSREEIKKGYVLACMSRVENDLVVEIPEETLARDKKWADEDAERFRGFTKELFKRKYKPLPLVGKVYVELDEPTLANNTADQQRVCEAIHRKLKNESMQMGLKIMKVLPEVLRENKYKITATVGLRREIGEVMNVEGGDTTDRNFMVVVDMGTTTTVAHLIDANRFKTVDAKACFNSQGIHGREVTGRMITAEKKGIEELQKPLIEDINKLIVGLAEENEVHLNDITSVVCAGNTAMGHFLLGIPTENIRRNPYVATSVEPPPLRAAEVGIQINPRGLLYSLPGISGWVGSDITAGILATEIHEKKGTSLLVDIGTNGEVILGNKEWLVASSASAGPALEGASVSCGMRAEKGAVEAVYVDRGTIRFKTIGNAAPRGICGSGIIDLVAVLLQQEIIDRTGKIIREDEKVGEADGVKQYNLVDENVKTQQQPVFITEKDIENIITAKAAIYAAIKILLVRMDLTVRDIKHFYIAGAFGNYINVENAAAIGLIPAVPKKKIEFVGNTSIEGAKIAAFYQEAFYQIAEIRRNTTYYDLMGAEDYVDEFKKAMFLPHTDIEEFTKIKTGVME